MKVSRPNLVQLLRQHLIRICILLLIIAGCAPLPVNNPPIERFCPDNPPRTIKIKNTNPQIIGLNDQLVQTLINEVKVANTTILLGPDVVLDFSGVNPPNGEPILQFGPCVTLMSVSDFGIDEILPGQNSSITEANEGSAASPTTPSPEALAPQFNFPTPPYLDDTIFGGTDEQARTSHSLGPLLKFGPHRSDGDKVFLLIECPADNPDDPDDAPSDNVRISGFRLEGPNFGQQSDYDIGIQIFRCLNIEISNMEIAGWGAAAVRVLDEYGDGAAAAGPGQEQPYNFPGERIGRPEQIRIFNNYIHHNQRPSEDGSNALGYGIDIGGGAWAQIYENVFDSNRHAIAAAWEAGGYDALRNLVLKGGGVNDSGWLGTDYTHQFDIHGEDGGNGGQAGVRLLFANNSFQYLAGYAINIRGRPREHIDIYDNVFAHEGLEDDRGDDAIKLYYHSDIGHKIVLEPNNVIDYDSYGRYGVCDFDGDGIDDLFLATGKTWWYSSYGEFQWTYLSARTERLNQVRLGYFDNDKRCDVLTESGAEWVISSGGTGEWLSIGQFGAPLKEVAFGQFDPNVRHHGPGATRPTTHAFWRMQSGEWLVTPLSMPAWQHAQSSSFPMSDLRFGDFTGDGVTDVLAVENGRWAISESARGSWTELNPYLSDDVSSLLVADLDNNNIDDLIKLERMQQGPIGNSREETFTWWVSYDGRSPWRELKIHTISRFSSTPVPVFAFAGRFGAAPGGGVLLTDRHRFGQFFSEAEIPAGAAPDWTSLFPY